MKEEINNTVKILMEGGVILYPTDTIWGLGCDATNYQAIKKIYKIKNRIESKALISLVANKKQLTTMVKKIPKYANSKNPTTIIYRNVTGLASNILAEDGSAGIRIVKDLFCKDLILSLGNPIVSTSANISKNKYPIQFSEIESEIIDSVDYIVNLRQNEKMNTPSRILKINIDGSIQKIR